MAPRTAKQFEAIREKSREKIIRAATELFARNGYHATSISQIAAKSGMSKGLMYNYFKNKNALLDVILKNAFSEGEGPIMQMQQLKDPFEKLRLIVEGSFAMVQSKKDRQHWQFLLSIMTQYEVMKHMQKMIGQYLSIYMGLFESLFREMGVPNPKLESYRLGAMLDGVMLHYLNIFTKDYPLEEMKNEMIMHYEKYRKKN